MEVLGVIAFVVVLALAMGILVIKKVIYICQPNEALIFSGKRMQGPDGRMLGYRVVQGGRGIRIPIFERVDRMDLTNMIIDVRVLNGYSAGGIPLTIQAVANIKIASHQPRLDNALERFLGRPRDFIAKVARETLEGNLRGVLAKLTPEEVNEDRVSFERALLDEADHDLSKLGLTLDTLTIQHISDDKGYLQAIGRKRAAELNRDARMAEARARAQAAVREAQNLEERSIAELDAQIQITKAEAEREIVEARTQGEAMVAEAEAEITAQKARAEADVNVQEARLEQVRRRLKADVLEPARAAMQQMEAKAKGDAARIVEDGKANAEALRRLFHVWLSAGDNARELFLSHKLDILLKTMMSTVQELNVDKLTIIDSKLGEVDRNGTLPMKAASSAEQIKETLGLDLAQLAAGLASLQPKG